MTAPWWAPFPAAEARIRCGTADHVLRWAEGRLSATGHADADGELVLAALGGDKPQCVAMLEAWGAHAADLDVLALGPRCPADELAVTWELVDHLRASLGPAARSVPMRPGPAPGPASRGPGTAPGPAGARPRAYAVPGTGSPGGSRPMARPIRGMPGRPALSRAGAGPGPARGTAVPVRAGPPLPAAPVRPGRLGLDRGCARGRTPGARQRAGRPGRCPGRRLAPAAGPWLGLDPDAVQATVHHGPGWGRVERDGPALRAALPLSWLARIWAPGFPVVNGHLVVDVLEVSGPRVQVLGLPAPEAEPAVLSIQADGENWSWARGER